MYEYRRIRKESSIMMLKPYIITNDHTVWINHLTLHWRNVQHCNFHAISEIGRGGADSWGRNVDGDHQK